MLLRKKSRPLSIECSCSSRSDLVLEARVTTRTCLKLLKIPGLSNKQYRQHSSTRCLVLYQAWFTACSINLRTVFNHTDPRRAAVSSNLRGFDITRDVYGAAVRACALSGGTGRALFLLKDATRRGVPLLPAAVAAVMRAAGWQQALAIYDAFVELAAAQAQTRSASEDTLGGGVGDSLGDTGGDLPSPPPGGQARQLHLLSEVAPGWEGVCQAALEVCAKGGKWESALEILNVLRAGGGGAELSREAYDKAIEVCGDAKAWDMVLLLVAEMRSDGVPTSPAAFETALKVCCNVLL